MKQKKLTSKKLISLLAVASLSMMGQLVQAEQVEQSTSLFKFPVSMVAPASGVTPNFTAPPVEYATGYFYSRYIKGLRVAGVLDWVKGYQLNTYSAPNAVGEKTLTQTCATEFHNPLSGVLVYTTPIQSLTSGLFSPSSGKYVFGNCGAAPANQAGNTLGLLVETVSMYELDYSSSPATSKNTVKLRVMNVGTKVVKWTMTFIPSATLGNPYAGEIVDTNVDGTNDLIIRYNKDVTPVGFNGIKIQYTRQVRNIATGALMAQFTWVETFNAF